MDRIHLLLSARPGHRDAPGASMAHRWRMLELACAEDPMLRPDDRELRRAARQARPSWTVETLAEVRAEVGLAPVYWVIGSDAFHGLPTWHRWTEILDLAHLVVLQRPGNLLAVTGPLEALLATRRINGPTTDSAGGIIVLDLAMLPISATAVRAALAAGAPVDDLLPPAVCAYISRHELYGVRGDTGNTA